MLLFENRLQCELWKPELSANRVIGIDRQPYQPPAVIHPWGSFCAAGQYMWNLFSLVVLHGEVSKGGEQKGVDKDGGMERGE